MTVRSAPMKDGAPERDLHQPAVKMPAAGRPAWLALGLLAWAFAVPGWLVGARLTFDGWMMLVNGMAQVFGFTAELVVPPGLALLGGTLAAGVLYSAAEVLGRPLRRAGGRWVMLPLWAWAAYALTLGSDYFSTGAGLLWPDLTTWPAVVRPALVWLAASQARVGVATMALTHLPEILAVGGFVALKRAFR